MTRLLTKKVPYTFNRAGYYYFSRRVPADLLSHYSYPRIVQGLKTRSAQPAKSRAMVASELSARGIRAVFSSLAKIVRQCVMMDSGCTIWI